jgi:hypothetical protein
MAQLGKFFEKRFKGKEVELYTGIDREWITYADSTTINGTLMRVIFKEYDEDSGVLIFTTSDGEHEIYVSEDAIEMFWPPGFHLIEHSRTVMNTGQRIFNRKNRDFM